MRNIKVVILEPQYIPSVKKLKDGMERLIEILKNENFEIEYIKMPLLYSSKDDLLWNSVRMKLISLEKSMDYLIDYVISLGYPCYYLEHPKHLVLLKYVPKWLGMSEEILPIYNKLNEKDLNEFKKRDLEQLGNCLKIYIYKDKQYYIKELLELSNVEKIICNEGNNFEELIKFMREY